MTCYRCGAPGPSSACQACWREALETQQRKAEAAARQAAKEPA